MKLEGISKSFPGVRALNDVSFELPRGEIIGLVGENGAGKSTLIKIIGGAYHPDEGKITYKGKEVRFSNPNQALKDGITVVYQELSLCENLSISENIGMEYLKNEAGKISLKLVDRDGQRRISSELFRMFGLDLDTHTTVKNISLAQQEQVEIMRAIALDPDLLILDEPTGPLSWTLVEKLFSILRRLRDQGTTILYISHEISEVISLCDRVVVLRDGRYITTLLQDEMEERKIANLMVGRELGTMFPEKGKGITEEKVLEVRGLSSPGNFQDINFFLRKGEILGISGLIGAGRTELALALYGVIKTGTGEIIVKDREERIKNPGEALRLGISYLTEDRKKLGLFLHFSILENLLSIDVRKYSKNNIIDMQKIRQTVREYFSRFSIKAKDENVKVLTLSGGNQQKILLSKIVSTDPEIMIIDEPTRGVDVGAKKSIHENIRSLTENGKSVILISSDMTEVIGMSDRIMIMDSGRLVDIIENDESVGQELIMNKIVDFKSRERTSA